MRRRYSCVNSTLEIFLLRNAAPSCNKLELSMVWVLEADGYSMTWGTKYNPSLICGAVAWNSSR